MDLHYKAYGEGTPFLILHGFLGASGNWHTLSRNVFAQHFRVLAIDQRNHGRSPHSDVFDYETLATDVLRFMDKHDIDRTHLLGHSMGGKTAMHVATRYPDRVDRLVIADISPRAYDERHLEILDALAAIDPAKYADRNEIDEALSEYIRSKAIRLFLMKNLTIDRDSGSYDWQMNLEVLRENYPLINEALPDDARFDGPTLFVRGDKSDYVPDEDRELILSHFPLARIVTLKAAGHWLHAEQPDAFGETVVSFLTS
jgi:esterase